MYTEDLTWRNGRILLGPNIDWWYITEKNQDELKYQGRLAHCFFYKWQIFYDKYRLMAYNSKNRKIVFFRPDIDWW